MSNEGENHPFDVDNLLNNVNADPILPAVHVGENDAHYESNNGNGVNEQTGIQELLQQLNALTQSLDDRDAELQRRLNALEQISSRGSTISTVSTADLRPSNNRFGITRDQNGGSIASSGVSTNGSSPAHSNESAPSAAVPNPSGHGPDCRHRVYPFYMKCPILAYLKLTAIT